MLRTATGQPKLTTAFRRLAIQELALATSAPRPARKPPAEVTQEPLPIVAELSETAREGPATEFKRQTIAVPHRQIV